MTVLNHSKVDSSIKEALRTTFPELYHKKTSIANSLAEPSEIIDFDAIRGSSNSSTPGLSDATKHAPISVPPSDNGKKESNHSKTKVVKEKIPKKETFEELFAENDLKTSAECEPSTSVSSDQGIVPSTSVSSGSDQGKVSKKRKRKSREKELHVQQLTNGLSTKERDEVVCNHDNHSLEVLLNMIREEFRDPIERLANSLNQNNSESVEVIQSLLNAIIEYV
jgi:hypothetical protein